MKLAPLFHLSLPRRRESSNDYFKTGFPLNGGNDNGVEAPVSLLNYMFKRLYYFYVYIIASQRNGTLYIGVTNNLVRRVWEHKHDINEGFTKRYKVHKLVYYEVFEDINEAIYREKCLKKWYRKWKLRLIEKENPEWKDLYEELFG